MHRLILALALLFLPLLPARAQLVNSGSTAPAVYLSAVLSASAQSVSSGVTTKVTLDSIKIDNTSGWSATNHNYNPQTAGTYLFCGSVTGTATTWVVGTNVIMFISKNGIAGTGTTITSAYGVVAITTTGSSTTASSCGMVSMNGTTDTIELDGYVSATTSPSISNGSSTSFALTSLTGYRVGN